MKQSRYLYILAALVAVTLFAAACGDSGEAEPATTTVASGQASGTSVAPTPDLSGVTLKIGVQAASTSAAIEASGALKGAAYKVEFATFTGPTPIMAALQANQLDAGHIGDYSLVVAQAAADPPWTATNVPFKMFYVYGWADPVNYPQIVTLAGKNSGIKTLADIKGKKFSYTVGGQTNLQYLYTLKKAGLKPSDVTPVQLDFAVGATALAGGDVDVWAGPITNAQEALASGARLLATGPEVGTTTLGGYVARTPLLDDPVKGAALRDFAARLVTYQKWVIEHPDDEAKIFVSVQKQTADRAATSAIYARQLVVLPDDAAMITRGQEVADDLFDYGLVKTKVDVKLGYDARFKSTIEQALKDTDFATVLAKGNAEAAAKNFAGSEMTKTYPSNGKSALTGAYVIHDDREALEIVDEYAQSLVEGAARRDAEGHVPWPEITRLCQSGLLAIMVPAEYGGPDLSILTLSEVFRRIAVVDPSIAQIPHPHYTMIERARLEGTEAYKKFAFAETLDGAMFGGAHSEQSGAHAQSITATLSRDAGGQLRLNGRKYYSTGAMFSRWVSVAALNEDGERVNALVPRDAPGLEVLEDWRSMGQRATVSGTTILDNTPVDDDDVHRSDIAVTEQITPFVQLTHASIDVGIARGAFEDGLTLARTVARPWVDAGVAHVGDEVHVIHRVGDLGVKLHAAEALLDRTADLVARARAEPRPDLVLEARLAVAEAKTFATDVVLEISTALFEIGGTRSTSSDYALDRHWRNARTHTLHNPDRWLRHHLGNFALHAVEPPVNGKI